MVHILLVAIILTACVAPPPRLGLAPVPICAGCLPAYPAQEVCR
jgi:hypothetical protein